MRIDWIQPQAKPSQAATKRQIRNSNKESHTTEDGREEVSKEWMRMNQLSEAFKGKTNRQALGRMRREHDDDSSRAPKQSNDTRIPFTLGLDCGTKFT